MGTPSSIKTDSGPAYISRQFKQFLQSFSIKDITSIPYNPQAQGIVEQAHHTLKLQLKKIKKGEYTGTFLFSLSRADFTRFQCNIFFNPIMTVNTALFVLIFLNLSQGDILTRSEKHFEELKGTSLPLPIGFSSVQFSCSVVSDSLRPHESQHARPPCPSPTPGVHSDSRPLSQ